MNNEEPETYDEWVCLNCWNRWYPHRPREETPDEKPQCSEKDCRKRLTIPFDTIKTCLLLFREFEHTTFLAEQGDELFDAAEPILETASPRGVQGADALIDIAQLAENWESNDPDDLREAVDERHDQWSA